MSRPSGKTPTHSFRIAPADWALARKRADDEGRFLNRVAADLAEGYADGWYDLAETAAARANSRRPAGSSARVDDATWARVGERAEREGYSASLALSLLVEGYGKGLINPPRLVAIRQDEVAGMTRSLLAATRAVGTLVPQITTPEQGEALLAINAALRHVADTLAAASGRTGDE